MAAEVGGDSGKKKGGKKGRKKKARPRIDMTAMVDLGFLLLTFFVLTTTMSTPTVMPVVVPADEKDEKNKPDEKEKVSEEKVLNLILTGRDRVYYYKGSAKNIDLQMTNFSEEGIRKTLKEKKTDPRMLALFPNEKDPLIVLIKMTDDAKYKNYVDIIDEMNIGSQGKYMLMEASKEELEFISDYEKAQNLESSLTKSLEAAGVVTK